MRHLPTTLLVGPLIGLFGDIAAAHEGHGFSGAHLHASDLFGPLVLALGAAAVWWMRRK